MNYENLILEKKEHIAKITLNRPERLNAVSAPLSQELQSVFIEMAKDDDIRVVVITGAGRAFCAGADVTEMVGGPAYTGGEDIDPHQGSAIIRNLMAIEKPTIAMVNGAAVGGGSALALACDMRTGSENTRFMNAFVRVGLSSGWANPWLYPKAMGLGKACEILFTGDFLNAEEAEHIGVLNRLVPAEELEKETMALAKKIAAGPPIAIKLTKRQVYQALQADLEAILQRSDEGENSCLETEDHAEGVSAFLEKRPPQFKGK